MNREVVCKEIIEKETINMETCCKHGTMIAEIGSDSRGCLL